MKTMKTLVVVSIILAVSAMPLFAASEHETHHPQGEQPAPSSTSGPMMGSGMMGSGMMGSGMMGSGMMGSGMMGCRMMPQQMDPAFYLSRQAELELTPAQVAKLKAVRTAYRKDAIRLAADIQIARLDVADLLSGDSWTMKEAEPLVRHAQKLAGDIHLRYLQAIVDARKVLTAEQLEKIRSAGMTESAADLFK